MEIRKSKIPGNSLLKNTGKQYDYEDSFQGTFTDINNLIQPADIGKSFFTSAPEWVSKYLLSEIKLLPCLDLKHPAKENGSNWRIIHVKPANDTDYLKCLIKLTRK